MNQTDRGPPPERPKPPRSLFKYTTAATALAILQNRSVRYSSPLLFNDPFDVQSGLHLPFDISEVPALMLDRIEQAVRAPDPPRDHVPNDPWVKVVNACRDRLPEHGFPKERFLELVRPSLEEMARLIQHYQGLYRRTWLEDFLPRLRVFCVSEVRDQLLMWAHYAADHTGAVFEFLSLPEQDNALSVATPINYCDAPPAFFDRDQWLANLFDVSREESSALYYRYARSKSACWSYEREWRVWYLADAGESRSEFVPVAPNELASIYLGCCASVETEEQIRAVRRKHFANARLFKARKAEKRYELEFDQIA